MSSAVPLQAHWTHPDGTTSWVGTLSLAGHAQIQSFTYAPTWLASGFEIGVGLPLQTGPLSPPGGMSTFGALDDAGPDSWGRRVISRSRPLEEVSTSLGMLAAVADESRQGALRLSTGAGDWLTSGQVAHVEELATVLADVEAFTRGEADTRALRHIYLGSSSQGGARPKSTLRRADGSLVLAKFPSQEDSYDVLTCEAIALSAARDAGLAVPDFRLIRLDETRAILLLDRFDRCVEGRYGYQSMRTAAMLGPYDSMTYQVAAETARYLVGVRAVRQVVQAAALAMCVHNIDDHARNLGFVHRGDGWEIAPLFDVVPYPDEQEGTPLTAGSSSRSLEQLLDTDWGLPRHEVAAMTARIAACTRSVWETAPQKWGLDLEVARACQHVVAQSCDFSTVLDGGVPRYGV
ncbi:type II toxin-antitoxin system HipA family toxin [Actinomyces urogenitalis]|uniref:type II toxin-antitoxin system HipA family toxin n=1 Tax=Actinomyces urogenitalis TaxID=103621 RepID=UPI0009E0632E|nr:type II toxin-antitoxin system HipA family toxin [Actinomyces urogenitalis]MDK8237981.1 type II toxin-antitoxin system HipA family toxin [Actinomyces urogenitalis]MDU0863903.1 type II toxin-antitoxin system HipA family toxin [Actinomyces urogenitalis]MDU0874513.1 type II toxin-antitoxin system HipA family toxin [Actinomyces urogenitalis]MDU1564089.1 type II toxin-antitoxin system HipA family toxin [Actinomyces urogenitalis]MDU1639568.1 type II toxin-antitoxin system HipA family toxin [Actin